MHLRVARTRPVETISLFPLARGIKPREYLVFIAAIGQNISERAQAARKDSEIRAAWPRH